MSELLTTGIPQAQGTEEMTSHTEIPPIKIVFAISKIGIGGVIVCANLLIVYAIHTREYLKTTSNKLLFHLAISDGGLGVMLIYFAFIDIFPILGKYIYILCECIVKYVFYFLLIMH